MYMLHWPPPFPDRRRVCRLLRGRKADDSIRGDPNCHTLSPTTSCRLLSIELASRRLHSLSLKPRLAASYYKEIVTDGIGPWYQFGQRVVRNIKSKTENPIPQRKSTTMHDVKPSEFTFRGTVGVHQLIAF